MWKNSEEASIEERKKGGRGKMRGDFKKKRKEKKREKAELQKHFKGL